MVAVLPVSPAPITEPADGLRPIHHAEPRPSGDAVGLLTAVVVLAFGLPSRLVFPPLGAAGRPALILSLGLMLVWGVHRLMGDRKALGRQPLRTATFVLGWTMVLTYAIGLSRAMPGVEARASDRFMLLVAGLSGLVLYTADGVRTRARLDVLLRRVTFAAAAMSAVGLVDFATGRDLVAWIRIPGLALNTQLIDGVSRGGFNRINATATHPIEFGVVLGLVLPLATHYVLVSQGRTRRRAVLVAAVIAAGIPLPVARSALIAAAVGMLVLATAWSWRRRLNATALVVMGLAAYSVVVPGLLGTLRGLFLNASTDGSVQVRTDDYGPAFDQIAERPWFGLGPGTFLPDQYRQLDNQVLKLVLEVGFVGLTVVMGYLLLAVGMALIASRRAAREGDAITAHLARALCGSVLAGLVVCFTFDSFTYQIYGTVLFLCIGAVGVLWRVTVAGADARPGPAPTVAVPG